MTQSTWLKFLQKLKENRREFDFYSDQNLCKRFSRANFTFLTHLNYSKCTYRRNKLRQVVLLTTLLIKKKQNHSKKQLNPQQDYFAHTLYDQPQYQICIKQQHIQQVDQSLQNMEKDNKLNDMRLSQRKIFPNLRKTYSASKNFITLAKVQIDKNVGVVEQSNSNFTGRQITTSFSHKRIISGANVHNIVQNQMSKTYRNFYQPTAGQKNKIDNLSKQKSVSISNLIPQGKESVQKLQQAPIIDKAKISIKPIGTIKGYSVNSHPGSLNTLNEDRICVITNLNKSLQKQNQISFFSIYDGKNGAGKAEYFRDNFHSVLTRDRQFYKDIETSIKKAILIIEDNFKKGQAQFEDQSTTNFLMAVIISQTLYIASMGENKMIVSQMQGKQLINPLLPKKQIKKSISRSKLSKVNPLKTTANMCKLNIKDLDFVVLGSEGLFQNFDQYTIGKKVWRELLEKTSLNFHLALGQTTNAVMNEVFQQASTKNVSLILIAFSSTQACFFQNEIQTLSLPYVVPALAVNTEQI